MKDLNPDDYKSNPLVGPCKYISHVKAGLDYIRPILEGRCDGDAAGSAKDLRSVCDGLLGDVVKMERLLKVGYIFNGSDKVKMDSVKYIFGELIVEIRNETSKVDKKMHDLEWKAACTSDCKTL